MYTHFTCTQISYFRIAILIPSWENRISLESQVGRRIQSVLFSIPCKVLWNAEFPFFFNTSSQAARRDQNRIAQREFRLRKQQRVS
jgi:hypothetical protein